MCSEDVKSGPKLSAMPTVCRLVAYWPSEADKQAGMVVEGNKWMAAVVTAVEDVTVNLTVLDYWGNTHPRQRVPWVDQRAVLVGVASWPPGAPVGGQTYNVKLECEDKLIERFKLEFNQHAKQATKKILAAMEAELSKHLPAGQHVQLVMP
jgi:hypothetical protein